MKISLNWLRDFVDIPEKYTPEYLAELLTLRTCEVEGFENQGRGLEGVVIGEMLEFHKHPDADKLNIAKLDIGKKEPLNLIFGQMVQMKVGDRIPVAVAPTVLPTGIKIEAKELRGVRSEGMLCLEQELGFKEEGVSLLYFPKIKPGTPLAVALGMNDTIFTIDNKSLTHRPDLWGHYGIAREIASITGGKLKPYQTNIKYPLKGEKLSIEVKDKKLCPRYIGLIFKDIKIEQSPPWLADRLNSIGYRSINNIVDATNYVMAELGQPMHAFDADKIEKGIIVRTAKKDETVKTLDGVERKMTEEMLVIADHKKPVAIAGVMGAANSEISESTTKIIIESANFHPSSVRKTALKLGLRTEAVQRFEKSLDPHLTEQAMDRICEIILKICPSARIAGPKIDVKNFDNKKTTVQVNLKKIFSKIGAKIPTAKVVKILESLEFKTVMLPENWLKIEIPTFRAAKDISMEDDIVEEVARMHGYENIEALLPDMPIKLPIENRERALKHYARQILALGLGFNEVYNYSFYSLTDINKCLLPEELHIKVQNYLSEDQTHLRVSMVPNMLKNIVLNVKNYDHFKLFEIGRTYEDLQEYFPIEEKKICAVIVQKQSPASSAGNQQASELFYQAKGALESFFDLLSFAGLEIRKGESLCPYAHPNRYAAYHSKQNDIEIARVFELHPLVARNYELQDYKIAVFEINFSRLAALKQKETRYKELPKFPGIVFDISFLIDKNRPVGDLQKILENCDKNLIREVKLFDIYEGPNIPDDKKSLAFQIHLQAPDRTLTDEEMKKVQHCIFKEVEKAGGQIRNS